ncbi:MAG: hypothetical protein NC925_04475, partial [Candidatus Omnitrophica bacterium]|nr:hypothetical protein [Candidatus Omnitrophota bacterium]
LSFSAGYLLNKQDRIAPPTTIPTFTTPPAAPAAAAAPTETPTPMSPGIDPGAELNHPTFDEGQDDNYWTTGLTHDIGVEPHQVGLIFGVRVEWNTYKLDGGCILVVLRPGWYENVRYEGRYEIYNLPLNDREGWRKVLINQRIQEQATNYGCPVSGPDAVWDSLP